MWLERLIEGDPKRKGKIFLVRYNELDVYVIAEWLGRPKDVFVDVLNIGKSLSNFGLTDAQELRNRLFKPIGPEQTEKAITQADSDFHHNLNDEDLEETERVQRVSIGE